jgi:hypothetical protein
MEFSDIQPASPDGHLQQQISIDSPVDLIRLFNSRANAGDQVELLYALAEGNPEKAIECFNTIAGEFPNTPKAALSLQGFGKLPEPLKQAFASCQSLPAQELLKELCKKVKERGNDLIAWSAAEALRETGFLLEDIQHQDGGNLPEPPRRIQNEILERKIQEINRIQRLDSRGEPTAEYERFLEFWIYGPTSEFFNKNFSFTVRHYENYINIAKDILRFTQIRGLQFGLNAASEEIREIALDEAISVFTRYSQSVQSELKETLGRSLKRFLKESSNRDSDLQALVKALICEQPRTDLDALKLAQLTIDQINREISQLEQLCSQVSSIFSSATNVSGEPTINAFLLKQKEGYLDLISSWIENLEKQARTMSALSVSQKANIDLMISVLNSIRGYDEALYQKVSNDIHSRIQRLNGSTATTQQEQNLFVNQLNEIKHLLSSSISTKLNSLKNESSSLSRSASGCEESSFKNKETGNKMLKYAAIFTAIGIFAEAIVFIVILVIIGFSLAASGG